MTGVHVLVRLGEESYALPVEHVLEVAEMGQIAAVPGAPSSVVGIRNLRGEILPVFDFAHVLGISGDESRDRLLVAEEAGRRVGLAIDEVRDVEGLPEPAEETRTTFLSGAALSDGGLVGIVDVPALFAALAKVGGR